MATYAMTSNDLTWKSSSIYGSSRLGVYDADKLLENAGNPLPGLPAGRRQVIRGLRKYELSNHLGNVLIIVSDKRTSVCDQNLNITHYEADIVMAQDYFPFGMAMQGRTYNNDKYRFGFNGQERDSDINEGDCYSFKYRIHDTRLGRFLSVDPLFREYHWNSTYAFAENDVIRSIDLEGLEKYVITGRSFIPMKTLDNPWYSPNFTSSTFDGDDRLYYMVNNASYRTEQKVTVDFNEDKISYSSNNAAGSTGRDKEGNVVETSEAQTAGTIKNKPFTAESTSSTVYLTVDAANSIVDGAPAINYNLEVTITPNVDADGNALLDDESNQIFNYEIKGSLDGFPAYELWITDETSNNSYLLLKRNPIESNEGPGSLWGDGEHDYKLYGSSGNETPSTTVDFSDSTNTPEFEEDCE